MIVMLFAANNGSPFIRLEDFLYFNAILLSLMLEEVAMSQRVYSDLVVLPVPQ